jgi:cell wall-associated NlpC family hydrolase
MKLHITIIVLLTAEWLIYLIVIADIIRTSSVWMAVTASDGSSPKDGSYLAKWIIWGVILTLSLSLSPHKAQGVFSNSMSNSSEATPVKDLVATPHETTTEAACFKSFAITETLPFMEILILERRYSLNPLTHPKPVVRPPRSHLQSNNYAPLLARKHNQLKSNDLSDRLLAKACHYLNTPYKRGGSLQHGNATDCSGFVQYIYKSFDVKLPRSSSEQAQEGKVAACTMDFAKLIPGDLLFFSLGRRRVGHVGIYLGEGKMIHAADSRHGVVVSDLRKPYYRGKFVVAKRILLLRLLNSSHFAEPVPGLAIN